MAKRVTKKFAVLLLLVLALAAGGGAYFKFVEGHDGIIEANNDPHAETIAANNLNCGLSVETDEGPYYISGTPHRKNNNLNPGNELEGEKIRIVGYVYSGASKDNTISNAKIEIWQPDTYGTFHPAASGDADEFSQEQLRLRGFVRSNEFGYFEFTTIYPGGSFERARHIYLKASAASHKEVTTQLVMARSGDFVPLGQDSVAQELPNCNEMHFGAVEGVPTAGYDLHLEKTD